MDLLFANLSEAQVLAGNGEPAELATRLLDLSGQVVIKLGAAGAVWADRTGLVHGSAHTVEPIDPTGAGDAFAAGFLSQWLVHPPLDKAAILACGADFGAAAVATVGGRPATR